LTRQIKTRRGDDLDTLVFTLNDLLRALRTKIQRDDAERHEILSRIQEQLRELQGMFEAEVVRSQLEQIFGLLEQARSPSKRVRVGESFRSEHESPVDFNMGA